MILYHVCCKMSVGGEQCMTCYIIVVAVKTVGHVM